MPTATPFTALGRGNGFASFCTIPISVATDSPAWELWELCPEEFTLEEVMNWAWNGHDYTDTSLDIFWDRQGTPENPRENYEIKYFLNYSEANEEWLQNAAYNPSGDDLPDNGQGLRFGSNGSGRTREPYERVCFGRPDLLFQEFRYSTSDGKIFFRASRFIRLRIVYDSANDNYRFLAFSTGEFMATEKYAEEHGTVNDTTTIEIPITSTKNISIPLATWTYTDKSFEFTNSVVGEIDFYTYS